LDLAVTKYPGGAGAGQFIAPKSPGGVFTPSSFGSYNSDYQVTFDVNSFSTFYVHPQTFPFAALPVELTSFIGWNEGIVNRLKWTTASEINTDRFEIEKSLDNSSWSLIGSKEAAGNSNQSLNYDFTDNEPIVGNNYYRLKILDNDGTFKFSNIINIPISEAVINGFSRIYPNPTGGQLNVELQATTAYETKITTYDVVGKKVQEKNISLVKGLNSLLFDFSDLAKGTYLLQFTDSKGKTHINKFVKD
ncbi:MAG TPA: T9SS type A sorting domain-containing protein, partial [Chitinophagales bacterium]|nr:T9SS type A sorting domain-containing protein [Chitinophagales bacterium]